MRILSKTCVRRMTSPNKDESLLTVTCWQRSSLFVRQNAPFEPLQRVKRPSQFLYRSTAGRKPAGGDVLTGRSEIGDIADTRTGWKLIPDACT